jgi:hypothetical protein
LSSRFSFDLLDLNLASVCASRMISCSYVGKALPCLLPSPSYLDDLCHKRLVRDI